MDTRWTHVINQRLKIFCIMKDHPGDGVDSDINRFQTDFVDREIEIKAAINVLFPSCLKVVTDCIRSGFGPTAVSHARIGVIIVEFETDEEVNHFNTPSYEVAKSLNLNPVYWDITRTF